MKQSSLLTLAFLTLASIALAQEPEAPDPAVGLSLSVVPKDGAEVEVGGRMSFTVKLTNDGDAAVELYELVEDRMVVSLDVSHDGGRAFIYEKIHPGPNTPKTSWEKAQLEPGQSWELSMGLPALASGTFSIKAHYARPARKPMTVGSQDWAPSPQPSAPHVVSEPVEFTVKPTAEGANALEVRIVTNYGPMRARLFVKDALGTCLHFANLIQAGVVVDGKLRRPFYDGLSFHRVIPGFMIQGGDPKGDGTGGPGYGIPGEFAGADAPEHLKHHPGSLSMARSNHPDSAGCQFFICVGSPAHLNGQYTSFGEVTRGLDVAYSMGDVDTTETASGERSRPLGLLEITSIRLAPVKR